MIKRGVWILLISLFLISCTPTEKVCSVDKDCIQASCCHANDAVNRDNAPDCSGILCTSVCEPETLDCGQGQVKCISGQCKAVIG
jgi:hypothetical protein